ncbi:hypothetical protein RUM44_000357 [Polyplax serrata]|uniref:Uncharacterized protein n=1 Tax=Polyplax serrata TaxID=468196 RepID=A0ABR1B566_POLSC
MDEEIYVSCHAPSLSLLLFETARSCHDQKGLLIGKICNEVISKKTDENEANCEHKTAIYLEHCIPIDDQDIIGNGGNINKSKFQKFTNVLQHKIVGWYSFRRNSCLVPSSLSEMLIHQSLLELLPNVKHQYFVACFMSSNAAANMSTHTFNHIFMTYDRNRARFESLRLKIYTLSDKSVNSNGYLVKNPFPTSYSFGKIINCIQKEDTPVKSVLDIHGKISELLKQIDKKLQQADNHRLQLEEEVEALKKRLGTNTKGIITVKEPEENGMCVKTIRYDPNIQYALIKRVQPSCSNITKLSVPLKAESDEKFKNFQTEEYLDNSANGKTKNEKTN